MKRLATAVAVALTLFVSCKKENALQPSNQQNISNISSTASPAAQLEQRLASLDATDSARIEKELTAKSIQPLGNERTAAFPGQCGNSYVFNSCYYNYEIWNDANNLYIDFTFPSQYVGSYTTCTTNHDDEDDDNHDGHGDRVGTATNPVAPGKNSATSSLKTINTTQANHGGGSSCGGGGGHDDDDDGGGVTCTTCNYYISLSLKLSLYDQYGSKLNTISLEYPNITTTTKRVIIPLADLKAKCGGKPVKCVSLGGSFSVYKKCGTGSNCGSDRVATVCITGNACQKYCLQICTPPCPTATASIDKTFLCGCGTVTGNVVITGDASKASTTWTVNGQNYTGNSLSVALPMNYTCEPVAYTVRAVVKCTTDGSVIKDQTFTVNVLPTITGNITPDYTACTATLELNCPLISDITWVHGTNTGSGKTSVLMSVSGQVIPVVYTVNAFGCTTTISKDLNPCTPP